MNNYHENIKKAKEKLKIRGYYESLNFLTDWDLWQGLAVQGRPYRKELQSFFVNRYFDEMSDSECKKLADYFRDRNISYENDYDRGVGRLIVKTCDKACMVPREYQIRMQNLCSTAQMAWLDARSKSDFNIFKPYLKEMFEVKKKYGEFLNPYKDTFDVLVGESDEGFDATDVTEYFDEVKVGIGKLIKKIFKAGIVSDDDSFNLKFKKETLKKLVISILKDTGFDLSKCTFGEAVHPMTYLTGVKDSRVTVKYESAVNTLLTLLHEGGHARYDYSSNDKAVEYGLWGGLVGTAHESQAKFYENIIGRSFSFWEFFYDRFQKNFEELKYVDVKDFYKRINKIRISTCRLESDEITYNLHPIIRFEMERDYFAGKLKIDDFKECWNEKYKEYIGIKPENDKDGILQDVHWAAGYVGYFQDYALGNIFDGQIRAAMMRDIPNMYCQIAKGDFDSVNGWLYENIYQYGIVYSLGELIEKSTGEKLTAKYYLNYLDEKYSDIYA